MPRKEANPAKQEQTRAAMLISAATSFDVCPSVLGIPRAGAKQSTCYGHGLKNFCSDCGFGFCQLCNNSATGLPPTFWNGRCSLHMGVPFPRDESAERVLRIAEESLGPRHDKDQDAGRVKRTAMRVREDEEAALRESGAASTEGVARKKRVAANKAAPAAPLAQVSASVSLSGSGAGRMSLEGQDTKLTAHNDGTYTLTFTAKLRVKPSAE